MDTEGLRLSLGRLLSDFDFMELDFRLKDPNVFSLFQMEYVEPKLSSFLAWLLDPNGGHGLEDQFLRRFLAAALAGPPPDRKPPSSKVSPIPYEAVCAKLLQWDIMDVMSADLRDTAVTTNLRRRSDGGPIDICLWNEAYSFVVYVENRVAPRHAWHVMHGAGRPRRTHESERYLLDIYSQWGSEDAGGYDILPVFLGLGGTGPSERHCFHRVDYTWMPPFLESLVHRATEAARPFIRGFCDRLKLEMPEVLDDTLHQQLQGLRNHYGEVVCRLLEHVSSCNGCDEDDLLVAFHDVYRRHREAVEYLFHFVESQPMAETAALTNAVRAALPAQGLLVSQGPATASFASSAWSLGQDAPPSVEICVSLPARNLYLQVYPEQAKGTTEPLVEKLAARLEGEGFPAVHPSRVRRTVRISTKRYDELNPTAMASDCVALFKLVDETWQSLETHH